MGPYIIKATATTPLVWIDLATGAGFVAGNSMPENAAEFYGGALEWLDRHLPLMKVPMRWEFRMHYFNTSSMKGLYQVLQRIKTSMDQGQGHVVVWDVEDADEFMQEAGASFIELLGIPMELRPMSEEDGIRESQRLTVALHQTQGGA